MANTWIALPLYFLHYHSHICFGQCSVLPSRSVFKVLQCHMQNGFSLRNIYKGNVSKVNSSPASGKRFRAIGPLVFFCIERTVCYSWESEWKIISFVNNDRTMILREFLLNLKRATANKTTRHYKCSSVPVKSFINNKDAKRALCRGGNLI